MPAAEHRQPTFLAKKPLGTVPELDDGTAISECTAITTHLDHQSKVQRLTGNTAAELVRAHMMKKRIETDLLDALATYFYHATPGLGPELETYQNVSWASIKRTSPSRPWYT